MAKLPDLYELAGRRPSLAEGAGGITAAKPMADIPRLGAEAEGISNLGKAVAGLSMDVATVQLREQEHTDVVRSEDALNQLQAYKLDLTSGEANGFQRLKGGAAVNPKVKDEWMAKFADRTTALAGSLDNDKQRERFRLHANPVGRSLQGDLNTYIGQQKETYSQGVFQATVDTEVRNAGSAPQDDLSFAMASDRVFAAIDREGDRRGQSPEQISLAKSKANDHLWTSRLESWRLQDPAGALKALQDNLPKIGPDTRTKLYESLFKDADGPLAATINANGGPPVTATQLARPGNPPAGQLMEYEQRSAEERVRAEQFGGKLPRGVRNNNPGNIVAGTTRWDGEIEGADPRYASFASPEAGIRALGRNLLSYQAQGVDTVQGIVTRWAPATENPDVQSYVENVAKKLGVNPTEPLNLKDRKVLTTLATAIIEQENGKQPYADGTIAAGLDAAVTGKPFAYEAKRSPGYSVASLQNMSAAEVINIQTGDPVIDRLPPDMKLKVFQTARTQANQGMTQVREAMRQRVLDTTAAYERGLDPTNPPSRTELVGIFGQFDGEKVAGDMDLARQYGHDVRSVQNLPLSQQVSLLAARAPAPGEGFAVAEKRHEQLARAVDSVNREREQDPALAVMRNSVAVRAAYDAFAKASPDPVSQAAAAQAFAATTLAEQRRLEVRNPQVLTKEMVDSIAKRFAEPPKAGENVSNVMRGMVERWGEKYWPIVGAQLKNKIPPEAVVIGLGITPEAETMLAETVKLKPEQLNQGLDDASKKDIRERVRTQFEPLRLSIARQGGGIETYDNYADAAEKLATALVQKGVKPKDAAQRAYDGLIGFKYEFDSTYRVPKTALGGDTTLGALRNGAEALKRDIGSDKPLLGEKEPLLVPSVTSGVRPDDAEKQWRETIKANGFWMTTPGDGGLTLYVKSGLDAQPVLNTFGKPVTRTWDQISGVGRSTRAAYMGDVYNVPGTLGGARKGLR